MKRRSRLATVYITTILRALLGATFHKMSAGWAPTVIGYVMIAKAGISKSNVASQAGTIRAAHAALFLFT